MPFSIAEAPRTGFTVYGQRVDDVVGFGIEPSFLRAKRVGRVLWLGCEPILYENYESFWGFLVGQVNLPFTVFLFGPQIRQAKKDPRLVSARILDRDLVDTQAEAVNLIKDKRKLEVVRYLAGPPVSEDDLKVLIQTDSLAASRLEKDKDMADRFVTFIHDWHDRRRFPWVGES